MESLTKDKIKKLSIFLLLVLAILAMTGIIAYAADVNSKYPNKGVRFYTGEAEFFDTSSWKSTVANYSTPNEIYGVAKGWAETDINYLITNHIIKPVEVKSGDTSYYYIPSDNYIVGQDALGITVMYHFWDTSKYGNITTYANRQKVYEDAGKIMDEKIGDKIGYKFTKINDSNKTLTRGEAALILASCLVSESGGSLSLDNYSETLFGRYADNQTLLDCYSDNSITVEENGKTVSLEITDISDLNNNYAPKNGKIMQALNLLADVSVNQGRRQSDSKGNLLYETKMDADKPIQYNEYYAWLVKVTTVPDIPVPEIVIPDPTLQAKLSLDATSALVDYGDFLFKDDTTAEITVSASAADTRIYDYKSGMSFDVNYSVEDKEAVVKNSRTTKYSSSIQAGVVGYNNSETLGTLQSARNSYTFEPFEYLAKDIGITYNGANDTISWYKVIDYMIKLGDDNEEKIWSSAINYKGSLVLDNENTYGLNNNENPASNTAAGYIKLYNEIPTAGLQAYTKSVGDYKSQFYYVDTPITIEDNSYDREHQLIELQYTIKRQGSPIATVKFTYDYNYSENNVNCISAEPISAKATATIMQGGSQYISDDIKTNATAGTFDVTFTKSGTYEVVVQALDIMKEPADNAASLYIEVGTNPQPPTANIKGLSYSYQNRDTVFTDASTDPNNDIVKWVWTSGEKPSDVKTVEYIEYKEDNSDTWRTAIAGENEDYEITGGTSCIRAYGESQSSASERAAVTINFKHLGTYRLHLKVTDATGLTDETYHDVQIIEGYPVPVPEVVNPPADGVTYTVTFIDAQDGVTTVEKIPAGTYLEAKQVPDKKTCEGYTVYGWTLDNASIVDPTTVQINGNLTFRVIKAPTSSDTNIHTVTFINTDGTITSLKVPDKSKIEERYIPEIVNLPDLNELGWIQEIGGSTITKSEIADITVTKDLLFWVLTEPLSSVKHQVMFINTDGSVTKFSVPHEGNISASQIPEIIDLPSYIESDNWICSSSSASMTVDEITKMNVRQDLVFWVNKTPIGTNNHLVTFINSDGEKTTIVVPDGGNIPLDSIPEIKDIPGQTENGWTKDGENVIPEDKLDEITNIEVTTDLTFWVDVTPDTENHTVTFINTDGTVTRLIVPDGSKISEAISGEIPTIVDDPDYTENGWVQDNGTKVYTPEEVAEIKVDRDMVFTVDLSPAPNNLTVTFINTDGTVTIETVPYNTEISSSDVPEIVDLPKFTEYGWTLDGEKIAYPVGTVVTKNLVFWVLKEPIQDSHTVTFINTDGSTTVLIVPDGKQISEATEGDIPTIIDIPGLTEQGWTEDGTTIIPEDKIGDIEVTRDMVFWVYTDPEYPSQTQTHTVTFINTDDTVTILYVVDGQKISTGGTIPAIKNLEGITENGWTQDGTTIIPESEIDTIKNMTVTKDLVFWVDTNTTDPDYPYDGAYFDDAGRLIIKQNRKVMLDLSKSITPDGDSIKWDETDIKIYTEGGITKISNVILEDKDYYSKVLANINADDTSTYFKGLDTENADIYNNMGFAFMCKETGEFKIKVKLHNAYTEDNHDGDNTPNNVTITVVVVADEPPEVELYVNNANPNFDGYKIENGQIKDSTNVMISSSASSPDGDYIDEEKYVWEVLKRTRTATSNYSADYTENVTNNLTSKSVSVKSFKADFKEKQTGEYKASLTVTEKFGAPTIEKVGDKTVITPDDYKSNSTEKEFEVNWIPRIRYDLKYEGNEWAYVNDLITIKPTVLDEFTNTCTVTWTLKRKVGNNYVTVNPATYCSNYDFAAWQPNSKTNTTTITFNKSGVYLLESTITDDHGNSESFVSNMITVYSLPVAVITSDTNYVFPQDSTDAFQFKQYRKFVLTGKDSKNTDDDSVGYRKDKNNKDGLDPGEINHSNDEWSIMPVNGTTATDSDIKVMTNDESADEFLTNEKTDGITFGKTADEFNEQIAILQPGTYKVWYQVTNGDGKTGETEQIITIVPDEAPTLSLPEEYNTKFYLGEAKTDENGNEVSTANITLSGVRIISPDYDKVSGESDSYVISYRYDANNDGVFDDDDEAEQWQSVDSKNIKAKDITSVEVQGSTADEASAIVTEVSFDFSQEVTYLGNYQFRIDIREHYGQETLSAKLEVDGSEKTIDEVYYITGTEKFNVEVDNIKPHGLFDTSTITNANVLFVNGVTSTESELNSKISGYTAPFENMSGGNLIKVTTDSIIVKNRDFKLDWNTDLASGYYTRTKYTPNSYDLGKGVGTTSRYEFSILQDKQTSYNTNYNGSSVSFSGNHTVKETTTQNDKTYGTQYIVTDWFSPQGVYADANPYTAELNSAINNYNTLYDDAIGEYNDLKEDLENRSKNLLNVVVKELSGISSKFKEVLNTNRNTIYNDLYYKSEYTYTLEDGTSFILSPPNKKVIIPNSKSYGQIYYYCDVTYNGIYGIYKLSSVEIYMDIIKTGFQTRYEFNKFDFQNICVESINLSLEDLNVIEKNMNQAKVNADNLYNKVVTAYEDYLNQGKEYQMEINADFGDGIDYYSIVFDGSLVENYILSNERDTPREFGDYFIGKCLKISSDGQVSLFYDITHLNGSIVDNATNRVYQTTAGVGHSSAMFPFGYLDPLGYASSTLYNLKEKAESKYQWNVYDNSKFSSIDLTDYFVFPDNGVYDLDITTQGNSITFTGSCVKDGSFTYEGFSSLINDYSIASALNISTFTEGYVFDTELSYYDSLKNITSLQYYKNYYDDSFSYCYGYKFNYIPTQYSLSATPSNTCTYPIYSIPELIVKSDYGTAYRMASRYSESPDIESIAKGNVYVSIAANSNKNPENITKDSIVVTNWNNILQGGQLLLMVNHAVEGNGTTGSVEFDFGKSLLSETLGEYTFDNSKEQFVIWSEDNIPQDFDDETNLAALINTINSANIHLIVFGSDENKEKMESLINQCALEGTFINTGSVENDLTVSQEFIKQVLNKTAKVNTKYVLVEEDEVNYDENYSDTNGHPQWFAGTDEDGNPIHTKDSVIWWYSHNPDYYCNSEGLMDNNETNLISPITRFTKPGLYYVNYQIRDNIASSTPYPNLYGDDNPFWNRDDKYSYWSNDYGNDEYVNGEITNPYAEIYAHRRPVADFTFTTEIQESTDIISKITIKNNAYDKDHYEPGSENSRTDRGLQMYEWKYQVDDNPQVEAKHFLTAEEGVAWINEQLAAIEYDSETVVNVYYRVRDIDGEETTETYNYLKKVGNSWQEVTASLTIPDGVWSNWKSARIATEPSPPVAQFKTNSKYYYLTRDESDNIVLDDVLITDGSYSPNGNDIVKWEWTVTGSVNNISETYQYIKNGSETGYITVTDVSDMEAKIGETITKLLQNQKLGSSDEENTYKISLMVTDDKKKPLTSINPASQTVIVVPVNNPPTIEPNDPDPTKSGYSVFAKDGVMVYEYDDYDATDYNSFFGNGTSLRGTEPLDWSVILDDPDNDDDEIYGEANNTDQYKLEYLLERFETVTIKPVTADLTSNDTLKYGPLTVTSEEALVNDNVAPFKTSQEGELDYGTYRITATVTDIPNNGSEGKTATLATNPDKSPKHLYVIPRLDIWDIHYYWSGDEGVEDTEEQIPVGDTITVTFRVNAETVGADVLMPAGNDTDKNTVYATPATYVSTNEDGTKNFTADVVIPDTIDCSTLTNNMVYTFSVEAWTDYGIGDYATNKIKTRTKAISKDMNVLALKLYNFHITSITDPAVGFDADNPVYVKDLAYDRNDSPRGEAMKKGYSFYFELNSIGLNGETDSVRIRPTFWRYNSNTNSYDIQLDMYYKNANGKYTIATYDYDEPTAEADTFIIYAKGQSGSELGKFREITLDDDDRTTTAQEQIWYGRYGLPSSVVFVDAGDELKDSNLYKGDVLISFEIDAIKNGESKFNYISTRQWRMERWNENGILANTSKAIYDDGAVIIIDGKHSAKDNYMSLPVWRQSRG